MPASSKEHACTPAGRAVARLRCDAQQARSHTYTLPLPMTPTLLSALPPQCNKLFIACDACKGRFRGCCCEACQDAPRLLRPAKTAGQYGNWAEYIDGQGQ